MQTFKDTSPTIHPVQNPKTTMTRTEIIQGFEAHSLLNNAEFNMEWDQLYQSCSWATAFQSRGYVTSWYKIFKDNYIPVIVYSKDKNEKLNGLLTMAYPSSQKDRKQKKIIGAGEYESEYQVWIANEEQETKFVFTALKLILETFPKSDILFRFIPNKEVLQGLETDEYWQRRSVIQAFQRPIMRASSEKTKEVLSLPRQFKVKLKKLQKMEGYAFEKVTDYEKFTVILKEIATQYDFRQAAMFNKNQFMDNPLKADFYLELFKQNQLHVTVLKTKSDIVASMVAVAGKDWVHLQGINTYSPFHAKYSPGMLHFYLLGAMLTGENVEYFDLTPGRDQYKERWATAHDEVYSLLVTENKSYLLKRKLRKNLHKLLIKTGYRPMTVELETKKRRYLIKNKGILKGLWWKFNKKIPPSELTAFKAEAPAQPYQANLPFTINKNSIQDMLLFEPKGTSQTRWEFIDKAMLNYGDRKNSFSVSLDDHLMACAWHAPENSTSELPKIDGLQENAHRLDDFYCHPEFREKFPDFIAGVVYGLGKEIQKEPLYLVINKKDKHILLKSHLELQELVE